MKAGEVIVDSTSYGFDKLVFSDNSEIKSSEIGTTAFLTKQIMGLILTMLMM